MAEGRTSKGLAIKERVVGECDSEGHAAKERITEGCMAERRAHPKGVAALHLPFRPTSSQVLFVFESVMRSHLRLYKSCDIKHLS